MRCGGGLVGGMVVKRGLRWIHLLLHGLGILSILRRGGVASARHCRARVRLLHRRGCELRELVGDGGRVSPMD